MKEIIRAICLIAVAFGIYKGDFNSVLAFISIMAVTIWAIPEIICFIFRKDDES